MWVLHAAEQQLRRLLGDCGTGGLEAPWGLRSRSMAHVWSCSQKRMFSGCLSRQRFWPVFLFLGCTSRNHGAGRALALLSL